MKTGLLIGLLTIALPLALQAEIVKVNTQAEVVQEIEVFDKIELKIPITVDVHVGGDQSVSIDGSDRDVEQIQLEVVKNKLIIKAQKKSKFSNKAVVTIIVESLEAVSVKGSGDMNVKNLDNKSFAVAISGSGDVRAKGSSDILTLSLNGSADFFGNDLSTSSAQVTINGSADARINVSDAIIATIVGSGDVHYKGSPTVTKIVTGSGSVQRSN